MTQQFDSQTFVRRMEAAGMTRAVAEELAETLGSVVLNGLATRRDVRERGDQSDGHLREAELRLRQEIKELELRLTTRFGAMMAASVAILAALITFK